ncbi:GNAT family N-acetyltransferase [Rhodoferax sp. AJA081-3]|uniref:GNAT family N-acetyltransferase n=1 Tax=Rhodoferax sp. AJA081-3 TaxID=2752316 RepID=UPI001AE0951D|nr:GNAT family N-acetyltransferase [Rhodoferax sp. AJA081-3]QTN29460.1 GNAT family N-acetyltransferase [Rhodoferax sp. AJA081-3]
MSLFLRAATLADAPAVADVYLSSRATFLAYAPLAHSEADIRLWIESKLIPDASVTVAQVGGEVVGFVATAIDGPLLWLDQLYVRPDSVGLGLGSKLLEHALAGVTQPVRLYTFQANAGARRFYERYGFKPVEFSDGQSNEEKCPDVLYERAEHPA